MSDAKLLDSRLQQCRRLFLKGFMVDVNIGIHDFERGQPQRLRIDVDLFVPLQASTPTHDELDEVVDYDFIRTSVFQRIAQGHINLQETLCDDLLALMLAHPRVIAARVSTQKPDVYPDCEGVGVEVFGSKTGLLPE